MGGKKAADKPAAAAKTKAEKTKATKATAAVKTAEKDKAEEVHLRQKLLTGALRYVAADESPEVTAAKQKALQEYKNGNPEVRNDLLEQYSKDKSLKFVVSWTKKLEEKSKVSTVQTEGWMSDFEIANLLGLTRENPRYDSLMFALLEKLVKRPHEKAEWAALLEFQYYYIHTSSQATVVSTETTTSASGKAAGKGSDLALLGGHGFCSRFHCCCVWVGQVASCLIIAVYFKTGETCCVDFVVFG